MDNNWDIFSMLKAYNSLSFAAISPSTSTTTIPINNSDMTHMGDPLFSSVPMSFTSSDPSLATTASGITTTNTIGTISIGQSEGFLSNKQIQQNSQMQPQQMNISRQVENAFLGSSLRLQETNPQGIRPRRYQRNNQPIMVKEMTKEQLAIGDSWMWRKYGQKPIKGSPYSRGYYKCKSFEGCTARKYVEKSSKNPSFLVVSYVGQHTHAQSIFQNSVPRSSFHKPNNDSNIPPFPELDLKFSSSSSSIVLGSNTSQNTLIEEGQNVGQNEKEKVQVQEGDNDENILLPNFVMAEDILKGFEELSGVNNGFAHSSDFLPQSWIPSRTTSISTTTNTTTTTTTFNGNGSV